MAKDAHSKTLRYIAKLRSIFEFSEEKLQISQDHDHAQMISLKVFTRRRSRSPDGHLKAHEGKFTVDQVGTYSVFFFATHEHNHEDVEQGCMCSQFSTRDKKNIT